jgi:hypothetical protein
VKDKAIARICGVRALLASAAHYAMAGGQLLGDTIAKHVRPRDHSCLTFLPGGPLSLMIV